MNIRNADIKELRDSHELHQCNWARRCLDNIEKEMKQLQAKANKYDNLVKEIEEQCKRDIEQARKEYKITLSDRQDGIREEAQNILELLDKEKSNKQEANKMCEFCNAKVYVKTQKIMKNILAPLTHTEELRQELEDLTGERYLEVKANYCFMCGRKLI